MFSKKQKKSLMSRFSKIDVSNIQDNNLRTKAVKLKGKQSGFTLLELLVVVAILAAIAGTATIALQDTDARASAAAHVAMMDELNKGIRTFRVLNKNQLPNNLDSLVATATSPVALTPVTGAIISVAAIDDVALVATPLTVVDIMGAIGMTYEQAGHSRGGLGVLTREGHVLTLVDRIAHHTTTGLSTVEISSKNASKLNTEFKKFFNNWIEDKYEFGWYFDISWMIYINIAFSVMAQF